MQIILAIIFVILGTVLTIHLINQGRFFRTGVGYYRRNIDTKLELIVYILTTGIFFIFAYFFII